MNFVSVYIAILMCLTSIHCRVGCGYIPDYVLVNKTGLKAASLNSRALANETYENGWEPHAARVSIATSTGRTATSEKSFNLNRTILDASKRCSKRVATVPIARDESSPPASDGTVNNIFDNLGITFDFFKAQFDRNSIDDKGLDLVATAHDCYRPFEDNAAWMQNYKIIRMGDGDDALVYDFGGSLDVLSHEYSHGVIDSHVNIPYCSQSGALHEHMADVFSVLTSQYLLKQTADEASWLCGEGLVLEGRALRDMANPGTAYNSGALGKDLQVGHMSQFNDTAADHCGVHINGGIPSRAFYLASTAIGGYAYEVPGKVWYHVLTEMEWGRNMTFRNFARMTVDAGTKLFDASVADAIHSAWEQVGVLGSGTESYTFPDRRDCLPRPCR